MTSIDLDQPELVLEANQSHSVRVCVNVQRAESFENIYPQSSLSLGFQVEGGEEYQIPINLDLQEKHQIIYQDEAGENESFLRLKEQLEQEGLRKGDSSEQLEDNSAMFGEMLRAKVKETESNFEESEGESSFLAFKRKLETGKLENLKMVSSFEPQLGPSDQAPEILECYENLITGNQVLEQKLKTLGKGLGQRDAMIRNLGGFIVHLESQVKKSARADRLVEEFEFRLENESGDLADLKRNYYSRKLELEQTAGLKKMNLGQVQREVMRTHEQLVTEYIPRREVVTWSGNAFNLEMFFMQDFGFFDNFVDFERQLGQTTMGTGGVKGIFIEEELTKDRAAELEKELRTLREEVSRQKLKSKKNENLIKFLNQNNEDLETKLGEAVERELQLTGEMRELALKGERSKGEQQKVTGLKREVTRLKNDIFEKNKEISAKLKAMGNLEEQVAHLKEKLEQMDQEKYRIEMEGKEELEELKQMVEQIESEGRQKEGMEKVQLEDVLRRERELEIREMKLGIKQRVPVIVPEKYLGVMRRLGKLVDLDLDLKQKMQNVFRKVEGLKVPVTSKLMKRERLK